MSASVIYESAAPRRPGVAKLWLDRFVWSLLVPAVGAGLILRFLAPSRMEGTPNGLLAAIARFDDRHPLIVGLALFIVLSEGLHSWRPRTPSASPAAGVTLGRGVGRWLVPIAVAALLALAIRSSVVETYRVVSPSMLPTFDVTDRLVVNKAAYGIKLPATSNRLGARTPKRGDVIVFDAVGAAAGAGPKQTVKRVLGLPGDLVGFDQGRPVINGWAAPGCDAGPYAALVGKLSIKGRLAVEFIEDKAYLTLWTPGEASFPGYRVKPGEVFVVGDDRGMSSDSRLWNSGRGAGVPIETIQGRVSRILLTARRDGSLDLSRVWTRPSLTLHETGVDLRHTEERIGECLKHPPAKTTPPSPGP